MAESNTQNIPLNADNDLKSLIECRENIIASRTVDVRECHVKWPINETGIFYNNLLRALENRDELTLGLMGMTGNGKSTFLNSLPGYFASPSFSAALTSNNFIQLIDYTVNIGQSDTQFSKTYIFRLPNGKILRIVDTPGIADTSGKVVDQRHLQNILSHFAKVEKIDVMCLLFKVNDNRATEQFEYVLKKLVEYFDKNIVKHFTFCFTHGSSCSFNIENAKRTVQSVFTNWSEKHDVRIQLTNENCFCVDSMPFETLMNKRVYFQPVEYLLNEECWERSGDALSQLFLYSSALESYNTANIESIAGAHQTIEHMNSALNSVTDRPTEGFLARLQQWLISVGVNCQISLRDWRFWSILVVIGIIVIALWKYYKGDKIMEGLKLIIEIAAKMRAFIEATAVFFAEDVFYKNLTLLRNKLSDLERDKPMLVSAFGGSYQLLNNFLENLAHIYMASKQAALKTKQSLTPKAMTSLQDDLYSVTHFGPSIRAAMNMQSESQNSLKNESDDLIIQLILKNNANTVLPN